jgi:hypothetical protein
VDLELLSGSPIFLEFASWNYDLFLFFIAVEYRFSVLKIYLSQTLDGRAETSTTLLRLLIGFKVKSISWYLVGLFD